MVQTNQTIFIDGAQQFFALKTYVIFSRLKLDPSLYAILFVEFSRFHQLIQDECVFFNTVFMDRETISEWMKIPLLICNGRVVLGGEQVDIIKSAKYSISHGFSFFVVSFTVMNLLQLNCVYVTSVSWSWQYKLFSASKLQYKLIKINKKLNANNPLLK